jgi:hypothetical protein
MVFAVVVRYTVFKEFALDKAQDEAGFTGAYVAKQNLIMRSNHKNQLKKLKP